jgi:hypothetical protein
MKNKICKKSYIQRVWIGVILPGFIVLAFTGCPDSTPPSTNSFPTIAANYNPTTGNVDITGIDTDDDFKDGNTVNYSTFGKKLTKVKANNVAGDTIQSIDLYVQGNFDFALDSSSVEHDHDDSTSDLKK